MPRRKRESQGELYAFLQAWHQSEPDEATDDRILKVADFVVEFVLLA
jgi:hypothetical protein